MPSLRETINIVPEGHKMAVELSSFLQQFLQEYMQEVSDPKIGDTGFRVLVTLTAHSRQLRSVAKSND